MKGKRAFDCGCGFHLVATNDEELYQLIRKHIDNFHPDMNLTRQDLERLISEKAYDLKRQESAQT